jgi:putative hemolysin
MTDLPPVPLARGHIVDQLIYERAPHLVQSLSWPLLRPLLYQILGYSKARQMAEAIAAMPGFEALDHVSSLLQVRVDLKGLEHVPASGRVVIVSNHPTGIADGIAMRDGLLPLRSDLCFFANADAHRVCPGFDDVLIPVEWVEEKRTREKARITLKRAQEAFEAERAVMIFPSGRLALRGPDGQLSDPDWMPSAISLARKYDAPVLPVHLTGPYPYLFQFFNRFSRELRDITLFHELLNKRGGQFGLTIGPLIPPSDLGNDSVLATKAIKAYVERQLPLHPDRPFSWANQG